RPGRHEEEKGIWLRLRSTSRNLLNPRGRWVGLRRLGRWGETPWGLWESPSLYHTQRPARRSARGEIWPAPSPAPVRRLGCDAALYLFSCPRAGFREFSWAVLSEDAVLGEYFAEAAPLRQFRAHAVLPRNLLQGAGQRGRAELGRHHDHA